MPNISLTCLAGPLKGQVFRLHGGPVFIFGRYAKASFNLAADPAASHLHFLIDTSEHRIRIVDLGSTNGLVINEKHLGGKQGEPFVDFVSLRHGDTILAGACLFRLSVSSDSTISEWPAYTDARRSGPSVRDTATVGTQPPARLTAILPRELVAGHLPQPSIQDTDNTNVYTPDVMPQVEGFTILQRIGGGGKGIVYRAVKDDSGDTAAIKMMMFRSKNKRQRSIEMFRREIQITKQLHHPHVIRYLADGIANGAPYLALEYVDGGNLDTLIANSPGGRMELPQAVPLFIQLLEAVSYMHNQSLVHRDIKPKNVLLDLRRGGSYAVKLSDMGLSCRFSSKSANEFLPIISEGGTPAYMPPEQLTDLTKAIPQSDVFSSAATLYQMLTGRLLYDFTDKDQNEAIISGQILPLQELRPDLPKSVTDVVGKALSYVPDHRQANAEELLYDFRSALA